MIRKKGTGNGVERALYCIAGGGLAAVYVKESCRLERIYYAHTDHPGSLRVLTDAGKNAVSHYGGALVVEMYGDGWGAVTFGSYILGQRDIQADPTNWLFQHEYGHYLQSQASGPLYLQRYGIPSAFSSGPFKENHNYHPAEQDANARALRYFNEYEDDFLANNGWVFNSNPIIGYNQALSFDDPKNQSALGYARLRPAWHDWILGPNYISGLAIHTPVLNSRKRYHRKLDDMKNDGFVISDELYY